MKGFAWVAQPRHEHLSGEGAGKKNEWVILTSNIQSAFEMLRKACLEAPVFAFADFNKPFLLETDTSKLGLGVVLSHKQPDGWYHPVTYVSWSLTAHEHNYHSTKQEFLVNICRFLILFDIHLATLFSLKQNNFFIEHKLSPVHLTWLHLVYGKILFQPRHPHLMVSEENYTI